MAMTIEQQKALAMAAARQRAATTQPSAKEAFDALPWYAKAGQAADDTVRFLANGATLGYADKIAGYLNGEGTAAENAKTERAGERAGSARTAAEIIGTMAPASALTNSALSATRLVPAGVDGLKGLLMRSLAAGADAGALGAIQASGNDQDIATGAGLGFAAGGLGNVAGEALTAGASKLLGLFNKTPNTMTADELKAAGQTAYQAADDAGVIFKPEAIDRLKKQVYADYADFGFHPKNQPGAGVAYDELARLSEGGNVSMKGLDTARKVAKGGFNPVNPSNNALIGKATDRIDEFAAAAGPDDVISGDPQKAAAALKEARDYWSRFRKLDKVQELLDRAGLNAGSTGSGGNIENATRQQLKRILTDKKMMRGFTADEQAAVKKAVLGSPGQNALRLAGKLAPQGNGLMAWGHMLGAATMPAVTIPAAIGGTVAKKTAEAMTRNNTGYLQNLIAAGGSKSALEGPKNALQRLTESQRKTLIQALTAAGLVAAGNH